MGVMLVGGVIALGIAIAYRVKHHPPTAPTAVHVSIPPNGLARSVPLPEGAKILGVQSDGDRVMVRLGFADGREQLILLDWKTGAKLSTLELK
jgi:hypothetical protein